MLQIYHIERQKSLLTANKFETQGFVGVAWSKRDKDLRLATIKPNEVIFWHLANVTQTLRQPGVLDENRFEATTFSSVCFD